MDYLKMLLKDPRMYLKMVMSVMACVLVISTMVAVYLVWKAICKIQNEAATAEQVPDNNKEEETTDEESSRPKGLHFSEMVLEWESICLREHAILFRPPRSLAAIEKQNLLTNEKHENVTHVAMLLLFILIISLARAAIDMSKQLKKKRGDELEEAFRRCSLRDYASKHKGIRAPLMKSATEDHGTAIQPAKAPWRPATLQRRSSVPALKFVTTSPLLAKNRRTSMDSFSEDESSPELKRRVRMIHRH